MPLPSDPSFSAGSTGNLINAQLLAPSATETFTFTVTNALYGQIQVLNRGGASVSATSGVNLQIFRSVDGVNFDTVVYGGLNVVIPTIAATQGGASYDLGPGSYQGKLINQDGTYATTVTVTQGGVG